MLIKYYKDGAPFASRTRDSAPRRGDIIRFKGVLYSIEDVVWIEDSMARPYVAIDIKPTV